jgi:hypothetical protein
MGTLKANADLDLAGFGSAWENWKITDSVKNTH